jgi:BMFP domain-containing protein YqiC
MEESQLKEVIEKGFKDVREELDQKFGDLRAELDDKFEKVDNQLIALRKGVHKAADDAHLAHVAIEGLRHDLGIFNEGETSPIETRVSALEVRVTSLERKRSAKK